MSATGRISYSETSKYNVLMTETPTSIAISVGSYVDITGYSNSKNNGTFEVVFITDSPTRFITIFNYNGVATSNPTTEVGYVKLTETSTYTASISGSSYISQYTYLFERKTLNLLQITGTRPTTTSTSTVNFFLQPPSSTNFSSTYSTIPHALITIPSGTSDYIFKNSKITSTVGGNFFPFQPPTSQKTGAVSKSGNDCTYVCSNTIGFYVGLNVIVKNCTNSGNNFITQKAITSFTNTSFTVSNSSGVASSSEIGDVTFPDWYQRSSTIGIGITPFDASSDANTICMYDMSSDFIFLQPSTFAKTFILPNAGDISVQKAIFIKIQFNTGASTIDSNVVVVDGGRIDNKSKIIIPNAGGCLGLFTNGSTYYICNSYDGVLTTDTPDATYNSENFATAIINKINIFSTDGPNQPNYSSGKRQTQNNFVYLPVPSGNPAMCIICYAGNALANRYSNKLYFLENPNTVYTSVNGKIDNGNIKNGSITNVTASVSGTSVYTINISTAPSANRLITFSGIPNKLSNNGTYMIKTVSGAGPQYTVTVYNANAVADNTTTGQCYLGVFGIQVDSDGSSTKSTGAIFISDGIQWYLAGWHNTTNWTWDGNTPSDYTSYLDIPTTEKQFALTIPSNINTFVNLPKTPTNSTYFIIAKETSTIIPQTGFSTFILGESNIFNDSGIVRLYYNKPGASPSTKTTQTCIWFVSEKRVGETFMRYYPICSYTP